MHNTTIKQFETIARQELAKHNKGKHEDDTLTYQEWLSENATDYANRYSITIGHESGAIMYTETNTNFKGNDICSCCDEHYDAEKNAVGNRSDELCDECYFADELELGDLNDFGFFGDETDALGNNFSDADSGL
jgi:hypothetical protein